MYEQIYNLTSMFFKSLKGNLMYEFLISKFIKQIVTLVSYKTFILFGFFQQSRWKSFRWRRPVAHYFFLCNEDLL